MNWLDGLLYFLTQIVVIFIFWNHDRRLVAIAKLVNLQSDVIEKQGDALEGFTRLLTPKEDAS